MQIIILGKIEEWRNVKVVLVIFVQNQFGF